jgi:hypothetical protein
MLKYHIQTLDVNASGSSGMQFDNIPQQYDDLLLVVSARSEAQASGFGYNAAFLYVNGSTAFSARHLVGSGSAASSYSSSSLRLDVPAAAATANTFGNVGIYIPNYSSTTQNKSLSVDWTFGSGIGSNVTEQLQLVAATNTSTAAVTTIKYQVEGSNSPKFVQHSSASLYGIKRGSDGKTETASGGVITQSGGYTIHTFNTSGTFVANRDLEVEYLVVAGGGGANGGGNGGVAGGAGGYRTSVAGQTSGAGSTAEPKLQLPSNQSFLVQVGSGGAGSIFNSTLGASGSASSFASIISLGGGRHGLNGGSGGGGGLGTTEQGFNGGLNSQGGNFHGGGGGGAGALGGNSTSSSAGNGGAGVSSNISGVSTTRAGGGGGGTYLSGTAGTGGTGGGGNGSSSGNGQSGTANTGGGGGGSRNGSTGGNGGSGVVIIRYLTPA